MQEREIHLLKLLSSHGDWVTSFSLSALLNISVRTVKNYVKSINEKAPNLIESSRLGYRIGDEDLLAEVICKTEERVPPQTMEQRKHYILCKLLLETEDYDLDVLAEELCISPVTLNNEVARLKTDLNDYALVIRTKDNHISIEGQESDKKKLLSQLIYEDSMSSFLSVEVMQDYLPNFDLRKLKRIIQDVLRQHHYFMDDFSLHNLVLQIAIAMERKLLTQADSSHFAPVQPFANAHIQKLVEDLITRVEGEFSLTFSAEEIHEFTLLVMTRIISDSINDINIDQLQAYVGDDVIRLVSLIQTQIKEVHNITITNRDFTVRFSLHLKNLLNRLEHGVTLNNPQKMNIKYSYPFIYEVAVFTANIISQETGFTLSEDEISYIAIHIGVIIEERKSIKSEIRAVLVAPQYSVGPFDLADRLSQTFRNNLLLSEVVSNLDELTPYTDYDLVISTIPITTYLGKPSVRVSNYLTNKDILAVSQKIEEVLKDRIKAKVKSKLGTFFKEELFFADADFENRDDAIEVMSNALAKMGYVNKEFRDKLFEREDISSSAYLNIAMPHPVEMCAYKSAIAVSVHPNPIDWSGSRVNIVFMLAINPLERLFFADIFDFITEIISEEHKLKRLLDVQSYNEFIATLVSFAE